MTISGRITVSFHRERMNEVARAMSYKKYFWTTFVFLAGGVLLLASTAFADAVEQGLVDALLGFLDEALPDGIAFLRRAEAEETERGVGEAVFGGRFGEHLRRHAARGEIDEVVAFERGFARGAIEFSEGARDMARLVRSGLFVEGRKNGAVRLDGVEILGQH